MTRLCKLIECIWICSAYRVRLVVTVLVALALYPLAGLSEPKRQSKH